MSQPITPNHFPRPIETSVAPHGDGWVIQPKYNGAAAVLYNGQLYSRSGKMFLPRVVSPITEHFKYLRTPRYVYGELWQPGVPLPEILGRLNHYATDDSPADLRFMIYECFGPGLEMEPYRKRYELLEGLADDNIVCRAPLLGSATHLPGDDIDGLIFRRRNGLFIFGKSGNVLKLKKWQEMDVDVHAYMLGDGATNNTVVGALMCTTPMGVRFNVGSGMTMQQRADFVDNLPRRIKIRFLNLSEDRTPMHPIFMEVLA